jgi:hypothetical protein
MTVWVAIPVNRVPRSRKITVHYDLEDYEEDVETPKGMGYL